jgi:hypothetical protein
MKARPPSPKAQLATFLAHFPPEIVALAKRILPKLRRTFPGALELVYDYPNSLVVAFGMTERGSDAIVALAILPQGVRLYFDKTLPDPQGLLEGTGTKVRSATVKAAADLDRGAINELLKAAIKRSGATFRRNARTRLIFKSESKPKPRALKRNRKD